MSSDEQRQPLNRHFEESEDDCESLGPLPEKYAKPSPWRRYWIVALFVVSIATSGYLGDFVGRNRVDLNRSCAAYTTQHSPVVNDVAINYSMIPFDGNFLQESVYRRPGSPEVDAAWEALGVDYRAGVISEEEGLRSGLSPYHVQRAQKYGGGFMVNVEGMHHLHCLNLVRKSLYFNYEYYKDLGHHEFKNEGEILRVHVTHCLDAVRQVLMCNVDTGVLGQVWIDPQSPYAFPDFNTQHQCKNYDAIRQWAEKHQAPPLDEVPPDYLEDPIMVLESTP